MNNINLNNLNKKFTIAKNNATSYLSTSNGLKSIKLPRNIKRNQFIYLSVAALIMLSFLAGRQMSSNNSALGASGSNQIEAPAPIATQTLNKKFKFPLLDEKGKEVAQVSYFLENANLQDAFIYQGKLAKAVKGRTFLIFNLKITNPYSKTIEINAKDYIRVKLNESDEQLAPEIHNDPVQIQANSTKYTRVGLPINDTDKNIILLIGELNGKKESIMLDLKR